MTCRRVGDAILDVGRGVPVPSPLARDLEEHVASCGACRAELQRQQELTSGLRALAARTPEWTAPAAMEADLLRQFAARQEGRSVAAVAVPGAADRRIGALRSRTVWYAAAVAAMVLVAAWVGTRRQSSPGGPPSRVARVIEQPAVPEVAAPAVLPQVIAAPAAPSLPRPGGRRANALRQDVVRPVEFVVLPEAGELPAFESGTIVRVEVPVAELPAYGLKIPPDASRANVAADLLVGQDGQARAIRLVPEPEQSRSRE